MKIGEPVAIVIDKRLPVGGGLGGGSSDAAAVLRALPVLWERPLERETGQRLAAALGSDVPFFLECGTVMAAGRGEEVTTLAEAPKKHLVVVILEAPSPTKTADMFAALQHEDFSDGARSLALATMFSHRAPYGDSSFFNCFEHAVMERFPEAVAASALLRELTGRRASVCGAGPSLYLALDDEDDADRVAGEVRAGGFEAETSRTLASVEALELDVVPVG